MSEVMTFPRAISPANPGRIDATRRMATHTRGLRFFPDYRHPLACDRDTDLADCRRLKNTFQIVLVKSGSCVLARDGRVHLLFPLTVLCLNDRDRFHFRRAWDLKADVVRFEAGCVNSRLTADDLYQNTRRLPPTEAQDRSLFENLIRRDSGDSGILPVPPDAFADLIASVAAIDRQLVVQDTPCWPGRSRSLLIEMLSRLEYLRAAGESEPAVFLPDAHGDDFTDVLRYIHGHYTEKLSIDDIARTFHTNRTTFEARFKSRLGTSFHAYAVRLRIGEAARLLRGTALPIKEIIVRAGYGDPSNFTRSFKRATGMSPAAYRKSRRAAHAAC